MASAPTTLKATPTSCGARTCCGRLATSSELHSAPLSRNSNELSKWDTCLPARCSHRVPVYYRGHSLRADRWRQRCRDGDVTHQFHGHDAAFLLRVGADCRAAVNAKWRPASDHGGHRTGDQSSLPDVQRIVGAPPAPLAPKQDLAHVLSARRPGVCVVQPAIGLWRPGTIRFSLLHRGGAHDVAW